MIHPWASTTWRSQLRLQSRNETGRCGIGDPMPHRPHGPASFCRDNRGAAVSAFGGVGAVKQSDVAEKGSPCPHDRDGWSNLIRPVFGFKKQRFYLPNASRTDLKSSRFQQSRFHPNVDRMERAGGASLGFRPLLFTATHQCPPPLILRRVTARAEHCRSSGTCIGQWPSRRAGFKERSCPAFSL